MISTAPIQDSDLEAIGEFLHRHHDASRSAESWAAGFRYRWEASKPNNGFQLLDDGRVAGVIGGIYSQQTIRGKAERLCNITSWCVEEAFRGHSNRLLMALLSQKDYHFTNFSPMPVVEKTLRFMKFKVLEETYTVVANPPWPLLSSVKVYSGAAAAPLLQQLEVEAYRDHQDAPQLIHALIRGADRSCYVALKRDAVKGLPGGLVMHASDLDCFNSRLSHLGAHMLSRYGMVALKVESRFLAHPPRLSARRPLGVPKYYLSPTLAPSDIGNLYSEWITLG